MGTDSVVVETPCLDHFPRLVQAAKPVPIQELVADTTVEALGEGVLDVPARLNEVELSRKSLDLVPVRGHPLIKYSCRLRTVQQINGFGVGNPGERRSTGLEGPDVTFKDLQFVRTSVYDLGYDVLTSETSR